ncbi:MAG TPA: DUF4112 domain-containing protein, partial [Urbifossiella sp.]|nr:DUF4112 domain-containing protein [Urbifossiella sp.]
MSTSLPRPQLILNGDPKSALPAVRALAQIMDKAITLPGTNISVGLDALLGLLPGIGDTISSAIGGYIVLVAHRLGAPTSVLVRMVLNLGVDAIIGIVPVVGDVLDIGWKANVKNATLLEQALANPRAAGRASAWVVAGLLVLVMALGAGTAALAYFLIRAVTG